MELIEGNTYTLTWFVLDATCQSGRRKVKKQRKERLIKCYKHHALFVDKYGIRRSHRYWDLDKLIRGEQVL